MWVSCPATSRASLLLRLLSRVGEVRSAEFPSSCILALLCRFSLYTLCFMRQVQDKFRLDLTDEQAVQYMQSLIDVSVTATFAALVEQMHKFAQVCSSSLCSTETLCLNSQDNYKTCDLITLTSIVVTGHLLPSCQLSAFPFSTWVMHETDRQTTINA